LGVSIFVAFVRPPAIPANGLGICPDVCDGGVSFGFFGGVWVTATAEVVAGFGVANGLNAPGCMAAVRTLLASVTMAFATTFAALVTTPTAVWTPAIAARSGLPLFASS